jgi:hypothetical protein
MFQGFGFAIPAAFITALTVMAGFVFALAGWGAALLGGNHVLPKNIPSALYTLTVSFLVQLAGPVVLYQLPYGFAQTPVHGMPMVRVVWSCFLSANFVLCITTCGLAKTATGPAASLLRLGSTLLLSIWGFGILLWVIAWVID